MKAFIQLVLFALLFALAVLAGAYVFSEQGFVLLSYGQYSIQFTLVSFLAWFGALWLAKWLVVTTYRLIFNADRAKRRANQLMQQGLTAFLLQDWARAEKLFSRSVKKSQMPSEGLLFAAVAADAMGDNTKALGHLSVLKSDDVGGALIRGGLLLKQGSLAEAGEVIVPLYQQAPQHDGVFSLYIKWLEANHDWQRLMALLTDIEKRGLYGNIEFSDYASQITRNSFLAISTEQGREALDAIWKKQPRQRKKQVWALSAYIEALSHCGGSTDGEALLIKLLKKADIVDYLPLLRRTKWDSPAKLNSLLQAQLKKNDSDVGYLCALGYVAANDGDHILASKALCKAAEQDPQQVDLRLLAQSYSQIGENQRAVAIYQKLNQ